MKNSLLTKAKRAVELATEKGSSNWLTVIPLKELDYNLNIKEGIFRDAIKLRYNWEITDTPKICICGVKFNGDHAMVCQHVHYPAPYKQTVRLGSRDAIKGWSVMMRKKSRYFRRSLGETLNHGTNKAPDARLDIQAQGFWERQRSAFFDVQVCHPIKCRLLQRLGS